MNGLESIPQRYAVEPRSWEETRKFLTENNTFRDFPEGPTGWHRHPNGNGWVSDTAAVDESCFVSADSAVYDEAVVSDEVKIVDGGLVFGKARVSGRTLVIRSKICASASVSERAEISKYSLISGESDISGESRLENTGVWEGAKISGQTLIVDSRVRGKSVIEGQGKVLKTIVIGGRIEGTARVDGGVVSRFMRIARPSDFVSVYPIRDYAGGLSASRNGILHSNRFTGRVDNFLKKVGEGHCSLWKNRYEWNEKYRDEFILALRFIELHFGWKERTVPRSS